MIRARPLYIPGNKGIASFTITEMNDGYTRYKVYMRETTIYLELYKNTIVDAWRMVFDYMKAYYGVEYMLKELDGKIFVTIAINNEDEKVKEYRFVIDNSEPVKDKRFRVINEELIELLGKVTEIHSVDISENTVHFAMTP